MAWAQWITRPHAHNTSVRDSLVRFTVTHRCGNHRKQNKLGKAGYMLTSSSWKGSTMPIQISRDTSTPERTGTEMVPMEDALNMKRQRRATLGRLHRRGMEFKNVVALRRRTGNRMGSGRRTGNLMDNSRRPSVVPRHFRQLDTYLKAVWLDFWGGTSIRIGLRG